MDDIVNVIKLINKKIIFIKNKVKYIEKIWKNNYWWI